MPDILETERLILRMPQPGDIDDSHAMQGDPVVRHFLNTTAPTREEAWHKILRNIGHWHVYGYGLFTLRRRDTGAFVGELGLMHFGRGLGEDFDPFPEAGWVLTSAAHGKGYATEALRAVHDWFGQGRAGERSVCIIRPDNIASRRVAEKLGYAEYSSKTYREAEVLALERRF